MLWALLCSRMSAPPVAAGVFGPWFVGASFNNCFDVMFHTILLIRRAASFSCLREIRPGGHGPRRLQAGGKGHHGNGKGRLKCVGAIHAGGWASQISVVFLLS